VLNFITNHCSFSPWLFPSNQEDKVVDLAKEVYGIIAIMEGETNDGVPIAESPYIYLVLPQEEALAAEEMIDRLGKFPSLVKVVIDRGAKQGPDEFDHVYCEVRYLVNGQEVDCFTPVHFSAEQDIIDQFLESLGLTGTFLMGLGYYEQEGEKQVINLSELVLVGEEVDFVQAALPN